MAMQLGQSLRLSPPGNFRQHIRHADLLVGLDVRLVAVVDDVLAGVAHSALSTRASVSRNSSRSSISPDHSK